jgi:hypothetical protein
MRDLERGAVYAFLCVVAVLLVLATVALAQENSPSPYDDRITAIEKQAADAALRNQLVHVFSVWMKDNHDQPRRAINGAQQARKAYIAVMTEIEKRDRERGP